MLRRFRSKITEIDWTGYILIAGIWLRLFVFTFLDPSNCDSPGHLEHILYIHANRSLPDAQYGHETWQPPLYYLLGAAVWSLSENQKLLQAFSLVTSIATLLVARRLISSDTFLKTRSGKNLAWMIVAFLPQFVMYGLQVSNDSLAILLAFTALHQADELWRQPTTNRFLLLTTVLSLGLLTKGQFLVISGILFPFACLCYWRAKFRLLPVLILSPGLLFLGCAKYIQNLRTYQRPLVSNMDFNPAWLAQNQNTYRGLIPFLSVNVLKFVHEPTLSDSTRHSLPLLLYGTFWYQGFNDSNLRGDLLPGPKYVGRYLYVMGLLPALLLVAGIVTSFSKFARSIPIPGKSDFEQWVLRFCAAGTFLASLVLLLLTFARFDAWSILQARHLFPTMIGACIFCDLAIEAIEIHLNISKWIRFWQYAFPLGAGSYFIVEAALQW